MAEKKTAGTEKKTRTTRAKTAAAKKTVVPDLACSYESGLIVRLSQLLDEIAPEFES